MSTLTGRELRQLKKGAKEFARRVQPNTTYYVIGTERDPLIYEIEFTKKAITGLRWGSFGPEQVYIAHGGQVYDDRGHPALSRLRTSAEERAYLEQLERNLLGSEQWAKEIETAASGTAFRSTWGSGKKSQKK